ncbi:GT-D fold domain-containing glycosyltransferase [Paenibacillus humicola]|uniref:GT-D fold domain-containing protein n=1 Tax=Paenibacillus humicola TaxID=3110540 RepID=UPI00237A78DF|nr:GT-D fold domain-containing glycosyltransferase [Paenibacillus humicola]
MNGRGNDKPVSASSAPAFTGRADRAKAVIAAVKTGSARPARKRRARAGSGSRVKRSARKWPRAGRKLRITGPARKTAKKEPRGGHGPEELQSAYELGKYEGGEMLLEQCLPPNLLLPEVSLGQIVAAGVQAYLPQCYPLLDVNGVFAEMNSAIAEERPCSVVRLGDGELLALAQGVVYDAATIEREGRFLPYAGVVPPDLAARDQLAQAIRHSQIVGVPQSRKKHFQPLLYPALRGHGIDPGSLRMTVSTINYSLYQAGLLMPLLRGRRLLLIGNAAPQLARVLTDAGCAISGVISPVRGFPDIDRVMREARNAPFDLALVSAGIPAVVICWRIAAERGKTALDFGHMADTIVKGEISLLH